MDWFFKALQYLNRFSSADGSFVPKGKSSALSNLLVPYTEGGDLIVTQPFLTPSHHVEYECPLPAEILFPSDTPSPLSASHLSLISLLQMHLSFLYCTYICKHVLSIYHVPGTKLEDNTESNKTHFLFSGSPAEGVDTYISVCSET